MVGMEVGSTTIYTTVKFADIQHCDLGAFCIHFVKKMKRERVSFFLPVGCLKGNFD